ncbi:TetR/AcrR family transcriptional regulator [Streptomyces sp. G-G2]|uniref:TetR/AcrR family transcriptional regulator n=1 Tax=Streptomyces sp. G-G2 TaxID=3046201 RepID=UPI0024BB6B00|nr:TetR/AcrR family transcriptional regulator [Streptomyces sp. G-G2]MDJ0380306.1 helix-turn-helix domain-containing protein [Streptomyces sp. G-G2]
MPNDNVKPLRADAVRNVEKIVSAARDVYAERGPDAPLDEIAQRAGVGIATLFRRFPDKATLLRAVLDQQFTEDVLPVIDRALADEDPRRGLTVVIETALDSAADEHHVLTAARNAGVFSAETSARFFGALDPLVARGQEAGVIRGDLVPDDLKRIMSMLVSVLWTMDPAEGGWRRYVTLVLDCLAPATATPLPNPAPPLLRRQQS